MSAKTILIVDDDPDMRRGLGTRLKSNGYEVAFAGDGILVGLLRKQLRVSLMLKIRRPKFKAKIPLPGNSFFICCYCIIPAIGEPGIILFYFVRNVYSIV